MRLALSLMFALSASAACLQAQEPDSPAASNSRSAQPASPGARQNDQDQQPGTSARSAESPESAAQPRAPNVIEPGPYLKQTPPLPGQQPKRILGLMPNFRAVSAGSTPPPPTLKQSFKIATQNSFDYSAFVFVGITSVLSEANDAHPQLGGGF